MYLGPDQMAVGIKASAEKLTFGIRALLEKRPDFAAWQIDLRNAFSHFSRAALLPGGFVDALEGLSARRLSLASPYPRAARDSGLQ